MPTSQRSGMRRRPPWRELSALLLSLAIVSGAVTASSLPAYASETVVELAPTDMAYTDLTSPNTSFATSPYLSLSRMKYRTYLAYDTGGLSPTATVVSAALDLTVGASDADTPGLVVQRTTTGWIGSDLTHHNQPDATSAALNPGDMTVPAADTKVAVALGDTAGIQPRTEVGFVVSYLRSFTRVQLSRADPPTLRLVVREALPAGPPSPVLSTSLPYAVEPSADPDKLVFAHYFPPYPISVDNLDPPVDYYSRNYLDPRGESGKYASVGGFLRDRPVGRPPIDGDYELADAMTEVQQAQAAGIDGFMIDIVSWTSINWTRTLRMNEAAAAQGTGFVTVPNIDLTADANNASVATVAAKLNEFYASGSAYRLADGRYVLSSFKAEVRSADWWRSVMTELEGRYGKRIAFIGVFLDLTDDRIAAYAPISYALSIWGLRTPEAVLTSADKADTVHRAGVKWMAPIVVQDARHATQLFAEAGNTETLRASWSRAFSDDADLVQLITWNDYSESTQFAPSEAHGNAFLDLNGYYAEQFKQGTAPPLTGDEVIVSHRIQPYATAPAASPAPMNWRQLGPLTPPRDTVEVLTMLQAPATVNVWVGTATSTVSAPAGVSAHTVPLGPGTVGVQVVRDDVTVSAVTSPHQIRSVVTRRDLQYYAASSRTG